MQNMLDQKKKHERVTLQELLKAGSHFGHLARYWNPKMSRYIFGERNKIHIINLEITLKLLTESLNFASGLSAKKNNKILFVGTKRSASRIIEEQATRCGMPYINHRWLGGTLTNYKTIRKSIRKLRDLETMRDENVFERLTKKEALLNVRALEKLERSLGGIKNMGGLPDAIFVIDVGHEKIAIQEANKLGIKVIGVVDTNNSPDGIDYVIPGNDDAIKSIELYASAFADAILDGRSSVTTGVEEQPVQNVKKVVSSAKKATATNEANAKSPKTSDTTKKNEMEIDEKTIKKEPSTNSKNVKVKKIDAQSDAETETNLEEKETKSPKSEKKEASSSKPVKKEPASKSKQKETEATKSKKSSTATVAEKNTATKKSSQSKVDETEKSINSESENLKQDDANQLDADDKKS